MWLTEYQHKLVADIDAWLDDPHRQTLDIRVKKFIGTTTACAYALSRKPIRVFIVQKNTFASRRLIHRIKFLLKGQYTSATNETIEFPSGCIMTCTLSGFVPDVVYIKDMDYVPVFNAKNIRTRHEEDIIQQIERLRLP